MLPVVKILRFSTCEIDSQQKNSEYFENKFNSTLNIYKTTPIVKEEEYSEEEQLQLKDDIYRNKTMDELHNRG